MPVNWYLCGCGSTEKKKYSVAINSVTYLADENSELVQVGLTVRCQTKFTDSFVELLSSFKRVFLITLRLRFFEEANILQGNTVEPVTTTTSEA